MKIKILTLSGLAVISFAVWAAEIGRSEWIDRMSTALPTAVCGSDMYFRQCFDISAQQCEETAASATRVCLNKYRNEIPDILQQPEDGTHWGSIVGACAGEAFELTLRKKRVNNERCNNPENWF